MEGATRTIGNNRSVRRNKDHCLHTTNSEDIRDRNILTFLLVVLPIGFVFRGSLYHRLFSKKQQWEFAKTTWWVQLHHRSGDPEASGSSRKGAAGFAAKTSRR